MAGKFFIESYGCQMNMAESGALKRSLIEKGWIKAENSEDSDLVIINTCSVRKTAENRIWGRLGYYKRLRQNHNFKLYVIGCMAERLKDEIKEQFSFVDSVLSNFKKDQIPDLINKDIEIISAQKDNPDEIYSFFSNHGKITETHSMVPIMNGCDNYCTYCIVPYVRGHEISRDYSGIIQEIIELNKNGISEITLLGQNVNSYKYDDLRFSGLLEKVLSETDTKWLRFTSSNPQDFYDELVDLVCTEKRICSFIHLPVQHGSDKILKKMNRKYTVAEYLNLVDKLKKSAKNIALSTDMMVGFPGEDESDFQELLDLIKTVRFEEAFTYYYNPREGTEAFNFDDNVPQKTKLSRLAQIIDLQNNITREEKQKRVGGSVEAVVEGVSKKDRKKLLARTEKNSMAVFPSNQNLIGEYVKLKLTGLKGNTFIGEKENV